MHEICAGNRGRHGGREASAVWMGKRRWRRWTLNAFDRAAGCEYGRVRTVPRGYGARQRHGDPCRSSATIQNIQLHRAHRRWRRRAWGVAGAARRRQSAIEPVQPWRIEDGKRDHPAATTAAASTAGNAGNVDARFNQRIPSPFASRMKEYETRGTPDRYLPPHRRDPNRGSFDPVRRARSPSRITFWTGRSMTICRPVRGGRPGRARGCARVLRGLMDVSYEVLNDHPDQPRAHRNRGCWPPTCSGRGARRRRCGWTISRRNTG